VVLQAVEPAEEVPELAAKMEQTAGLVFEEASGEFQLDQEVAFVVRFGIRIE
jgi:tagatose-1,6-bisphosphate aldolase non-catalytic subunit AgaZ/GatZ